MKKSTFKTITAVMLFSIAFSAVLFYSCKKNVGDVYDYVPVVLAPDFQLLTVDYAFSNEALNSESSLSFKVAYKNNEVTETAYSSVLNFYVDGVIQQSIPLDNLTANTKFESIFDWQASAGKHDFKFEINLSSDGSKIVEEANTSNNSQTTSLDIAVKKLVVVSAVAVPTAVAIQAITADPTANVASVMAAEGIVLSTTVPPVKTTYTNNTTTIVAAVAKSDGTIDPTKVVLSVTSNPGVKTGQEQESTSTMIVKTLVAQKEVSFYNANEKLTFTNGVISFVALKSAKAGCTEISDLESLNLSIEAKKALSDAILAVIASLGPQAGLDAAPALLIQILQGYGFTQGNVDNPPTFTFELNSSMKKCETKCTDGEVVEILEFPGFTLVFKDDRGTIATFTKKSSCAASNNGLYKFSDCGGNQINYNFNTLQPQNKTKDKCSGNVHNG